MNNDKHYVVILPTLMDDAPAIRLFTRFWPLFGLTPVVLKFGWKDLKDELGFTLNINKIINEIDSFSEKGTVSLIGCSAGGSAVINVFSQRTETVNKVINVCGALKSDGVLSKFDTPAYIDSLKFCEKAVLEMSIENKKRIMTIRPRFGDEFIKKELVSIENAKNTTIPTIEHMFSIFMTLTFFSGSIFNFLKETNK